MNEQEKEQRARKRARKLRNFYSSVLTFISVNILLLIINLISNPRELWFYWVTVIWGAVLVVQGFNTFTIKDRFLSEQWEEKKVQKLMEKDKEQNEER